MTDRKQRLHGGSDWFIDFQQGDEPLDSGAKPAQNRRGSTASFSRKQDSAKARLPDPSPWITDFLLNQVSGARTEARHAPRKPSPADTKVSSERSPSGKGGASVQVERDAKLAVAERGPSRSEVVPAPAPRTVATPPSVVAGAEARHGRGGTWRYAMHAILIAGVTVGLLSLPGSERDAIAPDLVDARTTDLSAGPQEAETLRSGKRRVEPPSESTKTLQPDIAASVESFPVTTAHVEDAPVHVASVEAVTNVVSSEVAPNTIAASPAPYQTTWINPSLTRMIPPPRLAVAATVRVVPAPAEVLNPQESPQSKPQGNNQVAAASAIDRAAVDTRAGGEEKSKPQSLRAPSRVIRHGNKRLDDVRPTSSRVAQVAQPRGFTLPAVLRPTRF